MKLLRVLLLLLIFSGNALAQMPDYKERIALINKNISLYFTSEKPGLYKETNALKNEKPYSYLWPLCALLQAENESEAIIKETGRFDGVIKTITENYYNPAPPSPGYQAYVSMAGKDTRYYDDNQWIGIALMDAYKRTGDTSYMNKAAEIYRFMMTGCDTISGGGIYWREVDKKTKNTCSNGPGIILALQLYNSTKQEEYLTAAKSLFSWVNKYLKSPEGIYYDALKLPELRRDSATYTYNTGTMLQSYIMFYNISGDKTYLNEAQRIAIAAKKHFYINNKLPDHYWFNAVLLRGFIELYKIDGNKGQLSFFYEDSERIWKANRDINGLVGRRMSKSLIDQSAMLEIFSRLSQIEQ
jgi:hypothetical protein